MKIISNIILIFLILVSLRGYTQPPEPCPEGQRRCGGVCKIPRECRPGVPPPPGLPINSNLPLLIAAGLGLGIYFLTENKLKKVQ
jgi:hypothetical protein